MNKLYFVAFGSMVASISFAQTFSALNDSVVETTGTYSANSTYMNFGLSGGKYNSFAVLDFDGELDCRRCNRLRNVDPDTLRL